MEITSDLPLCVHFYLIIFKTASLQGNLCSNFIPPPAQRISADFLSTLSSNNTTTSKQCNLCSNHQHRESLPILFLRHHPTTPPSDKTIPKNGVNHSTSQGVSILKTLRGGKDVHHLRCSFFRSTKCNVKLKASNVSSGKHTVVGEDTHRCFVKICVPIPGSSHVIGPTRPDFSAEQEEYVDKISVSDLSLLPSQIWTMVCDEFNHRAPCFIGLSKDQVTHRVYNCRRENAGGSEIQKLELEMETSDTSFLRYNMSFTDKLSKQRIMGFCHPELRSLLKYPHVQAFGDATFRCVPKPFKQLYIIMIYDQGTGVFVPTSYILQTGKVEDVYFHTLHMTIHDSDWKFNSAHFNIDFETAEGDAVRTQFPNTRIVGYHIHQKQALFTRTKSRKCWLSSIC